MCKIQVGRYETTYEANFNSDTDTADLFQFETSYKSYWPP